MSLPSLRTHQKLKKKKKKPRQLRSHWARGQSRPPLTQSPASVPDIVWHYFYGQNGQIPLFGKICRDLPLFWKYIWMYYSFGTWVCCVTWVSGTQVFWKNSFQVCHAIFYETWILLYNSSSKNSSFIKNWWLFFMELEFVKLKLHGN